MKIIIGSDHAGYKLKETVKDFLDSQGMAVRDVGTDGEDSVDYPDYGAAVASEVSEGAFKKGILICGAGVGMSIVANKYPGVRAALSLDVETAKLSRLHNDSNILVLAGRRTAAKEAINIVRTWLDTPFEGERHERRLAKITKIEEKVVAKK